MEYGNGFELLDREVSKAKEDFFSLQVKELLLPTISDSNDYTSNSSLYIIKINSYDDLEIIIKFVQLHSMDISCVENTFNCISKETLKQPQILVVSEDMSFFLSNTEIEKFVEMARKLSNNINVFFEQ